MKDSEKLVLFGILALIAWELYPVSSLAAGGDCQQSANSQNVGPTTASPWMQQLSRTVTSGNDYFTPQCGVYGRC